MSVVLVYAVFASPEEAQTVARAVIAERLAACANILTACHSIYEWEGEVREAAEVPAIFKTDILTRDALTARIADLHSYDVPAIVAIDGAANDSFSRWILVQVS